MGKWMNITLSLALGLCLRTSVMLQSYSGFSSPPMFGDYEAQRHWMEITVNLPVSEWYVNTSSNDLLYWGLDYPPLTAYHSYILGRLAKWNNQSWTELVTSRGTESPAHKRFMRSTVLLSDCLSFIPAAVLFSYFTLPSLGMHVKLSSFTVCTLLLTFPGIVLIDHGHFQYNCVSLGFFLASLVFFSKTYDILGGAFFCLAILYKQMELYHALPIFSFLLSRAFSGSFRSGSSKVAGLAITVIFTNALVLLPFLTSLEDLKHVATRMFPVDRGLFEDKVANFWCVSSILVKWNQVFSTNTLLCVCGLTTLLTSLPACLSLFRNPTMPRLILSEAIVALAFFLFSYQVHEKSILLVCVPVLCLLPLFPLSSTSFLLVATLSMWQLLVKDGLCLAGISCVVLFYFIASICFSTDSTGKQRVSLVRFWPLGISLMLYAFTLILQVFVPTPSRYPHLFFLFVSALSFAHFLFFFLFWYWHLFHNCVTY